MERLHDLLSIPELLPSEQTSHLSKFVDTVPDVLLHSFALLILNRRGSAWEVALGGLHLSLFVCLGQLCFQDIEVSLERLSVDLDWKAACGEVVHWNPCHHHLSLHEGLRLTHPHEEGQCIGSLHLPESSKHF